MTAPNVGQPASASSPEQITAYPSSQTIPASGELPAGGSSGIIMDSAIGGHDGAWVVVRNAKNISAAINETEPGGPSLELDYGHFVKFGSKKVPDALIPWDGSPTPTEEPNQPIYVEAEVPYGTAPGEYRKSITIDADGSEIEVPITVNVYNATLPKPNKATNHNPLVTFNVSPQTYIKTAAQLYNYENNQQRQNSYNALYDFFAEYRISPASWGFGEPRTPSGYSQDSRWWINSAQNMINAVGKGESKFPVLRIPVSNNRTSPNNYIAGLNPSNPESWCGYLKSVRSFWAENGWLKDTVPYLYGQDEPGLEGQKLVERQAKVAHRCFPGAKVIMTGNPSPTGDNNFLYRHVDKWVVLASRTRGEEKSAEGINRSNLWTGSILKVKKLGKTVWSYTYNGPGMPGYTAAEPLSNPRMFMLWNALEQNEGTLYTQGMTTYDTADPLKSVGDNGEHVLIYPGQDGPVASARLEQIRLGIEDWAILNSLGAAAVRRVLGYNGLFSADASGVKTACRTGCELVSDTKFAWPKWSKDNTTAQKIDTARTQILKLAAG